MAEETTETTTETPAPAPSSVTTTGAPDPPAVTSGPGEGEAPVASVEPSPGTPSVVETPAVPVVAEPADETPVDPRDEEIAAYKARVDAMDSRLAEQRKHLFDAELGGMRVKAEFRKFAKLELGDIDVSTAAGKAKLETWVADHPSVIDIHNTPDRAAEIAKAAMDRAKEAGGIGSRVYSQSKIEATLRDMRKGWSN